MTLKNVKYDEIVKALVNRIKNGELTAGMRLPGQFALAEEYGVSAITANRALNELRKLGFLERRQRSGSYVAANPRFISQILIVIYSHNNCPESWLRSYWDEIWQINQTRGVATRIIRREDPELSEEFLQRNPFTGVILAGFEDEKIIERLTRLQVPYLVMGIRARYSRFNVTENRNDAARKLAEALYRDGARNFMFAGNLSQLNHQDALEGCRLAVAALAGTTVEVIDTDQTSLPEYFKKDNVCVKHPQDALLVMGSTLPFQLLSCWSAVYPRIKLGFFTESAMIMNLRTVAYLAVYRQAQVSQLAVAMLDDIAAGKVANTTVKFADVEILMPGDSP